MRRAPEVPDPRGLSHFIPGLYERRELRRWERAMEQWRRDCDREVLEDWDEFTAGLSFLRVGK